MAADSRRPKAPQSVTRVIQVLEILCASRKPIGLAELSRALGTPKSSLAALLRGLAENDFVVPLEGAYGLGPAAFGLGSALLEARRHVQSSDVIRAGMRRLAERSGETVLFGVMDEGGETLTYVDVTESQNVVRFAVSVGDRRPLYCSAGGRILLASGSEERLCRYLAKLLPVQLTHSTETDPQRLAELVATARVAGFAQTVDQSAEGVTGTAAVLRDAAGSVTGALIVAAPSSRLHDRRMELAQLVIDEAEIISRHLGHRQPKPAVRGS